MYTRCPECSTCFRVTERHLAIAKGKVRCGKCQLVFNAPDNAIDDLPDSQLSSEPASKPLASTNTQAKPAEKKQAPTPNTKPTTATAAKNKPAISQPAKKVKAKETKPKENKAEKKKDAPVFKADATMIADINSLDHNELDNIDLDSIPGNDTDDDIFDDSFDLNAAIDELTQATENKNEDNPFLATSSSKQDNAKNKAAATEKYIPDDNHNADVFDTDAYNATSAGSVADIMNEMEGQMSLDIAEPEPEKNQDEEIEYDVNNEFDFLKLDEEPTNDKPSAEKNNAVEDEIEIIGLDDDDEIEKDEVSFELEHEQVKNIPAKEKKEKKKKEKQLDAEALFDQVDLSDFDDSDVGEKIVLENTDIQGFNEDNIGKHADENEIPFQLRDDLEHLNAPSRRLFSPVFTYPFVIFLIVLSFSQLSYFRAYELVNVMPSTRPLLEKFCDTVDCFYSGPRDTKQIDLLSRDVRLHPKEKNALLISAAIINNAYFAQPYPDIHIRLSDISGNVVAERIFNAKTYMGKISNPFLLMKSKTPVHINFEVVDPGKDAINFEFTFL